MRSKERRVRCYVVAEHCPHGSMVFWRAVNLASNCPEETVAIAPFSLGVETVGLQCAFQLVPVDLGTGLVDWLWGWLGG